MSIEPRKRARLYVEDIISYAKEAIAFLEGVSEEEFETDRKLQLAVAYAIQVIGEAASAVPEEIRALAPDVPWRQIVATRNKIVHHYFGVKQDVVWRVVMNDLPELVRSMELLRDEIRER